MYRTLGGHKCLCHEIALQIQGLRVEISYCTALCSRLKLATNHLGSKLGCTNRVPGPIPFVLFNTFCGHMTMFRQGSEFTHQQIVLQDIIGSLLLHDGNAHQCPSFMESRQSFGVDTHCYGYHTFLKVDRMLVKAACRLHMSNRSTGR